MIDENNFGRKYLQIYTRERRNLIDELYAERPWLSEGESQEKERGTKLTSINQVLTEGDEERG